MRQGGVEHRAGRTRRRADGDRRGTSFARGPVRKGRIGHATAYFYWQEDGAWLGYLAQHPDYMTQGTSLSELRENLRDIYVSRRLVKKLRV
jgi:hypothetical protein